MFSLSRFVVARRGIFPVGGVYNNYSQFYFSTTTEMTKRTRRRRRQSSEDCPNRRRDRTPGPSSDLSFEEYLKKTPSSPYVPSAPPVIQLGLSLLFSDQGVPPRSTANQRIHVDVGSGDGRVCEAALLPPFSVDKTIAMEIDESLVESTKSIYSGKISEGKMSVIRGDFRNGFLRDVISQHQVSHLSCYFVESGLKDLVPEVDGFKGLRVCTFGYEVEEWKKTKMESCDSVIGVEVFVYKM